MAKNAKVSNAKSAKKETKKATSKATSNNAAKVALRKATEENEARKQNKAAKLVEFYNEAMQGVEKYFAEHASVFDGSKVILTFDQFKKRATSEMPTYNDGRPRVRISNAAEAVETVQQLMELTGEIIVGTFQQASTCKRRLYLFVRYDNADNMHVVSDTIHELNTICGNASTYAISYGKSAIYDAQIAAAKSTGLTQDVVDASFEETRQADRMKRAAEYARRNFIA